MRGVNLVNLKISGDFYGLSELENMVDLLNLMDMIYLVNLAILLI